MEKLLPSAEHINPTSESGKKKQIPSPELLPYKFGGVCCEGKECQVVTILTGATDADRKFAFVGATQVCTYCDEGFFQELDDMDMIPTLGLDSDEEREPGFGILEAFSALVRQQIAGRTRDHDTRGRTSAIAEQGLESGILPWLIFRRHIPFGMSKIDGMEVLFNEGPGVGLRRSNISDYFMGPRLHELIEQLSRNNRTGPHPVYIGFG